MIVSIAAQGKVRQLHPFLCAPTQCKLSIANLLRKSDDSRNPTCEQAGLMSNTVPFDLHPSTEMEAIVSIVALFVGLFLAAVTISSTTSTLSSIDAEDLEYRRHLRLLLGYMQNKRVNPQLVQRITEYFQFCHRASGNINVLYSEALPLLPSAMHAELQMHLHRKLLLECPLFDYKRYTVRVVLELLHELTPLVCVPKHHVVNEGQINTALYIINHGILEVWRWNQLTGSEEVIATLTDKDFFGEKSLMNQLDGGSGKTIATVKCVTFCDMLVLELERFRAVLTRNGYQEQEVATNLSKSVILRDAKACKVKKAFQTVQATIKMKDPLKTASDKRDDRDQQHGAVTFNVAGHFQDRITLRRCHSHHDVARRRHSIM